MLKLLSDEHISHVVATGLIARQPEVSIISLHHWRNGELVGQSDHAVLMTAAQDGLTLVTFDQRTIPTLTVEWWEQGLVHAGVIFVDERTIRSDDYGRLIRSLETLWLHKRTADWAGRIMFVERS